MARKKTAAPKHVEAPDEGQGGPEAEGTDSTSSHGRKMPATKTDAIRMAIAGGFGGPQEGSGYVRSQFGMDVSPQHFSSTKSQLKSKMLEGKPSARSGRKPKETATP